MYLFHFVLLNLSKLTVSDANHTKDLSIVDPYSAGHEGKGTASILLSFLTFGTTYLLFADFSFYSCFLFSIDTHRYLYCLQRWKRLTPDMVSHL